MYEDYEESKVGLLLCYSESTGRPLNWKELSVAGSKDDVQRKALSLNLLESCGQYSFFAYTEIVHLLLLLLPVFSDGRTMTWSVNMGTRI